MQTLEHLFKNNVKWAEKVKAENPQFFKDLATKQTPKYLWIGCADSRVPASQIMDLLPGEVFEHRNIANCVINTDLNCLSVIYYAIEVLKIKHIIVCGHYDCGGVHAATLKQTFGLADHWLSHVRHVYQKHQTELAQLVSDEERLRRLVELNVITQVGNVTGIPSVQDVWRVGRELSIHGWVYDVSEGLLKRLIDPITTIDGIAEQCQAVD